MRPRLISCFLIIFFALSAGAQDQKLITYNDLPFYGIDMVDGWRYRATDRVDFAAPNFDESAWAPVDLSKMLHELPELKQVRIGWLRLRFKVGPLLGGKTLLFLPFQNAAAEIYLDGKLIKRYGTLSLDPAKVVPIGVNQRAQEIHLTPGKEHVLAVRFAPWRGAFFLKDNGYLFRPTITDLDSFQQTHQMISTGDQTYVVLVAIFLLISLLHLSFYRYDPSQRANLFFAIYTMVYTVAFLLVCFQSYFEDMRYFALVRSPAFLAVLMSGIWIVKALGSLFSFRTRRLVWCMWILYFIGSVAIVWHGVTIPFYTTLIIFELIQLWLLGKALIAKKRGAWIIAVGFFISILMVVFTILENVLGFEVNLLVSQAVKGLTYLAPAFSISLYLAREFALDSSLLREKLVQVEILSTKSLAQEQEKQQLLARQNDMLESQVTERTAELSTSLDELRSAQAQLIQSEKMASLGELTAGIAHEIQNPLNFVNNFSEVSVELAEEMEQELDKGDTEEAKAIAKDIKDNLAKIAMHGRRADGIVKGMLQHSRPSTGYKEPIDLNVLANEYLRLAYHGLRAKEKSFNATLETNFDETLPKINAAGQDIGRVLLNLFTNAFYATWEKSKQLGDDFKPTVTVSTRQNANFVQIQIRDNGTGIPEAIKDKILQPFFTTKPAGIGTGLGLSLSYDIVVKGHGGKIEIDSIEGEGSTFTISLP